MAELSASIQHADWKAEKHVPVIECPDEVRAGEMFEVRVGLGKEEAHPNTTEHHIRWTSLYFLPEGDKFQHEVGHFRFSSHGESVEGPNQGSVHTGHSVVATMSTTKRGTLHALAYCNIHGLWESSKGIALQ